ncbi:MAG: S8 family serine peptidase [Acidobacteriaceae bacterium]|nr:S8 family serine peptidase [Acidobacteriaceae bacterium]
MLCRSLTSAVLGIFAAVCAVFAQSPRLDPALEPALASAAPVSVLITGSAQNQQQVIRRSLRLPPGPRAVASQLLAWRRGLAAEMRRESRPQQDRLQLILNQIGATKIQPFPLLNLIAAEVPGSSLPALLASPDILSIEKPANYQLSSTIDVQALGAPFFWAAGASGEGVPIAILDTGIRATHQVFAGKEIYPFTFVQDFRNDPCLQDNVDDPADYHGHGTHVAAIAAGQSLHNFSGVAPGVGAIYSYKVGVGTAAGPPDCEAGGFISPRAVLKALEHLVENTPVQVVNMSFGSVGEHVNRSQANIIDFLAGTFGINFVIAAGNSGPGNPPEYVFPVGTPGSAANGITVANVDTRENTDRSSHTINPSSSRGPAFDGRQKPDLAAPGTNYLSAGISNDASLVLKTGTSMAAPAVAGAVALLRSAGVTDWREVKAVLINSATSRSLFTTFLGRYWDEAWGHGYLNLQRALASKDFRRSGELAPALPVAFWRIPQNRGYFSATAVNQRQFTETGTPFLHSLALSVYREASGQHLNTSAERDQVVQLVDTQTEGDLILRLAAPNLPPQSAPEPFALALSAPGAEPVAPPALRINCTAPATVRASTAFDISCSLANPGGLSLFSPRLTIANGPATPAGATDGPPLAPGATARANLRLTAPATPQTLNLRLQATAQAFDLNLSREQVLTLNVEPAIILPQVAASASELNLSTTVGADPAPQSILLSASGAGVSFAASTPASWLTLTSPTGPVPTTLRLTIQARTLAAGTYSSRINIALAGAATPSLVIPVTLRVNPVAAPATTFRNFTTAKSVTSTTCIQPASTFNFTPQDPTASLWFEANNARRGDIVRYLWTAPNGATFTTQTEPALARDGNFCLWQNIALPAAPTAAHLGIWNVQVSYNGAAIHTAYFIYSKVTLLRALTTRSVPAGQGCTAPIANATFSRSDQQALAWFLVSGAAAGDVASIRWIDPAGATFTTSNFNPVPTAGSWCHTAALPLSTAPPGAWTVVWQWNNAPVYYERFTLAN